MFVSLYSCSKMAEATFSQDELTCPVCVDLLKDPVTIQCGHSYCQNHLEQHESLFKRKKHNLTDATGRLQEMICQKHEKLLEVYCLTDQKYICVLCTMDEHKNHDTVSTAAQRTEKQVFKLAIKLIFSVVIQ